MPDYAFNGPADIDRAIGILVALDEVQVSALAELEIDSAIEEAQAEFEKSSADPSYVPPKDFIVRLDNYLALADKRD